MDMYEAQAVHEKRQQAEFGHDKGGCWCCCIDCDFDFDAVMSQTEDDTFTEMMKDHREVSESS